MLQTRQGNNSFYATIALALAISATLLYPGLAQNLLNATGFIPHGHCYLWKPELVWLHVSTDTIIGVCYVSISSTLAYLVYRTRKEIPFHWMFLVFGAFIIACGTTHFVEVITLWHPIYWLSGDVKLITALASVSAALTLPPLVPKVEGLLATLKLAEERRQQLELAKQSDEEQTWLKTNVADLTRMLQGQRNLTNAASLILTRICSLLEAQQGVFYWLDRSANPPMLERLSQYATPESAQLKPRLHLGEGLIGQCAIDQKPYLLSNVPSEYVRIGSGLGDAAPRHLIVLPILFETQVVAVIELASLKPFSELSFQFLNESCDLLGVVLTTIAATARTTDLLMQSQSLTEELQQQQAELQETNCRLEEQANELQRSEAQLREQQEELQQTNEQLQQLNLELEEKANQLKERNREVERKNREVEHARQALEEKATQLALSSRYKSEFLANMSHELRTPLNSLLILANLLSQNRDRNLTEKQIEYSQTIYAAGNDLLDLINDILDLAKIESGKLSIEPQIVLFTELKTSLENIFNQVAHTKGLDFAIALNPQLPTSFITDSKRLQQILRNLLSNAFKFTASGSVTLSMIPVTPDPSLNERSLVVAFSVTDTGIGISPEKQVAIFEAFQQADGTTSRKYGGTGLGLSISRELAHLLGGQLTVKSQEGQGSTFTVYLPSYDTLYSAAIEVSSKTTSESSENSSELPSRDVFQESSQESSITKQMLIDRMSDPIAPNRSEYAVNGSANVVNRSDYFSGNNNGNINGDINGNNNGNINGSIKGYTNGDSLADHAIEDDRADLQSGDNVLLIIEDDLNFAHSLLQIAHQQGFKGLVSTRSDTGLELVRHIQPVAIMLNIRLADGWGWQLLEQLKSNAQTRGIPVYVLSVDDHLERSLQLGAVAYLQKPVTPESLNDTFSALRQFMEQQVKQLLVVEDDRTQAQTICELLGQNSLQPTIAASGAQALDFLQSGEFDCAVLDLILPDMNGFDLLEQIKEAYPTLPIVVYTGKELTLEEETHLKRFTETIIIKDVRSLERLFDEIMLFLYQVQTRSSQQTSPISSPLLPSPSLASPLSMSVPSPSIQTNAASRASEGNPNRLAARDAVLAGKKVLIIDDDVRNIFAITSLLEEYDVEVFYAENGQAGLRVLNQHPEIHLVLMDVMMPEMDGYEATRAIRSQNAFRSLPIIALTAKAMQGDREKCLEVGASDYITKPVNPDQLISLLRVWLYG
ncbi:response regulator [Leptolyngbya sp. GB1-A1]|uniref:response regulator n=1 Tax=Leptolyngbya sp. GB1-A1 TaxID=2933908 RepID=UPI0032986875